MSEFGKEVMKSKDNDQSVWRRLWEWEKETSKSAEDDTQVSPNCYWREKSRMYVLYVSTKERANAHAHARGSEGGRLEVGASISAKGSAEIVIGAHSLRHRLNDRRTKERPRPFPSLMAAAQSGSYLLRGSARPRPLPRRASSPFRPQAEEQKGAKGNAVAAVAAAPTTNENESAKEREKVEGTQFARRKLKDVESGGILEIGATPLTEQCGRVRVLLMSRMILQIRDGRMDKGEDRKCLLMHIYSLETSSR